MTMNSSYCYPNALETVLTGLHSDAGHQALERMEALVRARCYWPRMHDHIKHWIIKCHRCTVAKFPHCKVSLARLHASNPFEVLAIDFTILEPSLDGRENVLVMTDVFTKYTIAVTTRNRRQTLLRNSSSPSGSIGTAFP